MQFIIRNAMAQCFKNKKTVLTALVVGTSLSNASYAQETVLPPQQGEQEIVPLSDVGNEDPVVAEIKQNNSEFLENNDVPEQGSGNTDLPPIEPINNNSSVGVSSGQAQQQQQIMPGTTLKSADISTVDGDTFILNGNIIRIDTIDAPSISSQCWMDNAPSIQYCGKESQKRLSEILDGWTVTCIVTANIQDALVATCSTPETRDVGRQMILDGYAFVNRSLFPSTYYHEEQESRHYRRGLWKYDLSYPWQENALISK